MRTAIRCKAITLEALAAAERHGKRLDQSSQARRVSEDLPISIPMTTEAGDLIDGLDLRELRRLHVGDAAQSTKSKSQVLHFIAQFPPELLEKNSEEKLMVVAKRFVNQAFGGDAVFGVRYDRDEKSVAVVDVFAAPKYVKKTGRTWVTCSLHGKELCKKHEAEIIRRSKKKKFSDAPRNVGIALQSEWRSYVEQTFNVKLEAKCEKESREDDWKSPEALQRLHDIDDRQQHLSEEQDEFLKKSERFQKQELEQRAAIEMQRQDLNAQHAKFEKEKRKLALREEMVAINSSELREKLDVLDRRDVELSRRADEFARRDMKLKEKAIELAKRETDIAKVEVDARRKEAAATARESEAKAIVTEVAAAIGKQVRHIQFSADDLKPAKISGVFLGRKTETYDDLAKRINDKIYANYQPLTLKSEAQAKKLGELQKAYDDLTAMAAPFLDAIRGLNKVFLEKVIGAFGELVDRIKKTPAPEIDRMQSAVRGAVASTPQSPNLGQDREMQR